MKTLVVRYETEDGIVHALNGIDLQLGYHQTIGLVGETGAGKTTAALAMMRLVPSPPGVVECDKLMVDGRDILNLPTAKMEEVRGKDVSMIFQDPMTALNPVFTVGEQIAESLELHEHLDKKAAMERAKEMLELVGIPGSRANEYPHQFSGGMKQRVVIAIALACNPKLLIADEPTTALDVTIQAQVLELMSELKEKYDTSMILITHDLGIVAEVCDTVAVMYAGASWSRARSKTSSTTRNTPTPRAFLTPFPTSRTARPCSSPSRVSCRTRRICPKAARLRPAATTPRTSAASAAPS